MLEISSKKMCSGCGACANACPKQCIRMEADEEGFLYPVIDIEQCVNCHICEKVCPIVNQKTSASRSKQKAFAAYNLDEQVRLHSSSGGIFTLLAQEIIRQGGIVYGAALSDDCRTVSHIAVDSLSGLTALQGSKYVQSSISGAMRDAKEQLESGRTVLFTGTPCQIGGLYAYLRKDYPNLYTQDLICHGAPSPKVWERYVEMRTRTAGSEPETVSFRCKNGGWKLYSMLFRFKEGAVYEKNLREDLFMKGFLADMYLRPSCHACSFKGKDRQADITLADFWGVQNVMPEMDDNKGTSVVWVHSEKGARLFEAIQKAVRYEEIDIEKALVYNHAAVNSVPEPRERKRFWAAFKQEFPSSSVEQLSRRTIWKRAKKYLARLKRKLFT